MEHLVSINRRESVREAPLHSDIISRILTQVFFFNLLQRYMILRISKFHNILGIYLATIYVCNCNKIYFILNIIYRVSIFVFFSVCRTEYAHMINYFI